MDCGQTRRRGGNHGCRTRLSGSAGSATACDVVRRAFPVACLSLSSVLVIRLTHVTPTSSIGSVVSRTRLADLPELGQRMDVRSRYRSLEHAHSAYFGTDPPVVSSRHSPGLLPRRGQPVAVGQVLQL